MNDLDPTIRRVFDAYAAAVFAKDPDAFAAIYAADVRVFDLWGAWTCDGLDAWRSMARGWFASLGDERVRVTFDDVRSSVGGDLAVVHAFVTYRGEAADGTMLRAMDNRLTWSLARVGDAWKIAHEHTSAPVDHATTKAMLRR